MGKNILIVDDDESTLVSLSYIFKKQKLNVFTASNGKEALLLLKGNKIDIVLTDFMMPDIDGFELLKIVKSLNSDISVIMITAYGTMEKAIKALKEGASDFIVKPLNKTVVVKAVETALEKQKLLRENTELKEKLKIISSKEIIGQSKVFKKIISDIKNLIAKTDSTVMISGESGTGKEVIANYIHESSKRKNNKFVAVNISSLSEGLIESELFGHKKGAFTGALRDKKGYFEVADKGTLFLDEIGDLPLSMQVKILRFIQEGEIIPVGSTESLKVDVRIITATNKDLFDLIKEGKFREDLYYRLNVIPVYLPPLRDRKEDIPLLVDYFLDKYKIKYSKPNLNISDTAMEALKNYSWPGNVRELENIVERLVVLNNEIIEPSKLPKNLVNNHYEEGNILKIEIGTTSMEEIEKMVIEKTLKFTNGDKNLASKILGISLRSIYRKI